VDLGLEGKVALCARNEPALREAAAIRANLLGSIRLVQAALSNTARM
jgi:hypothetical protein